MNNTTYNYEEITSQSWHIDDDGVIHELASYGNGAGIATNNEWSNDTDTPGAEAEPVAAPAAEPWNPQEEVGTELLIVTGPKDRVKLFAEGASVYDLTVTHFNQAKIVQVLEQINININKKGNGRPRNGRMGKPWYDEEDEQLIREYTVEHKTITEIAEIHERSNTAIRLRLEKHQLLS